MMGRIPAPLLLGMGLILGCSAPEQAAWHEEAGYRWQELQVPSGAAGFTAMSGSRIGVTFQNTVDDSILIGNRMLAQGAGTCLGDVDGDGLTDLFLARTEGANALFRNLGGWKFEEIATRAGVAAADRFSSGCALADLEGDGDLDLILLATLGPNAIFLNDGTGVFTEHGAELGLDVTGRGGTTIALADVDGNGTLDLYTANYKPYSPVDIISPQQRAPNQIVRQTVPDRYEVVPEHQQDFKLVMRPDMGGLNLTMRAERDAFYLNEGGRFTPVVLPSERFLAADGRPLETVPESFALGARFADLNGDGAPDLYVANDFEDPDLFWLGDGAGGFRLADWTVQRQMSNSTMGTDVGDINADGLPDLFMTDMLGDDSRRLKTQMPTHSPQPKRPGDAESQLQLQRNTLFLNRGDGSFTELSELAGVEATGWSWGTMFMDVDLDGWQDLLIATGHPWDVMDADTQERLQNRLTDIPWQRQRWEYPALPLPNRAFRNRGDLTFEDVGARWGFGTEPDISHAVAAGDLDGDGDLDVVINRLGAPALVLRNNASAPRLAVRLVGDAPNTRAVGARITVRGGASPVQRREVTAGGLYLSHSDYLASFATGSSDSVSIVVDWRDGRRTVIEGARPNRLYEISTATAVLPADSIVATPMPLFADASAMLGGHRHTEAPYDDWERQFLLPNALSQGGPGVAWFDLDRDGDEDLIVGAGQGGRLAAFLNQGGRLVPQSGAGPLAPADLTTILGMATPAGSKVLAGLSNWEAASPELVLVPPAALAVAVSGARLAATAEPLLPPLPSATGPMALGDYSGDGQLDLFVGGRVVPGRYPAAASSMLFRGQDGTFVPDSASAPALAGIGMVTGAVFADIDGDGDADLVLSREWGSLVLLLNTGGRYALAPDSWGLARWSSRWNGVATGDLDGDGRLDLVATSWGRNVVLAADTLSPLVMAYGRFGRSGQIEMVPARNDPRIGGLAPLSSYARVRVGFPDLANRIRSFGAYADATLGQVLGPVVASTEQLTANTMDQMVFLNRGDHFEAAALPLEAQFAPASHASIADFDGDGFEDLFLSQNFFPTQVGAPRYDAGRGLLLRGDGSGGLTPMSAVQSGIMVLGDQRGAAHADFDGDGRLDLVVTENAGATRLFRNQAAAPGIRVRLAGPAANPDGIGAQVRLVVGDRMGPVREVQAGSGYWSQNGAVQVLGAPTPPTAVWVRWPGGAVSRTAVPAGAVEVVVRP
ncbi:MAG: FG-GAP-like repeat-containing protein [Gemmatimonadota bacterium]|nr:FG-GAP-like repeat-containing protein [Gemmatimonadota bacterium]